MSRFLFSRCLSVLTTWILLATGSLGFAQNAPVTTVDPAEWAQLTQQKDAFVAQMKQIETEFQAADEATRQQLIAKAQQLQQSFQQKVSPRMVELAPAVYAQNPADANAGEIVMQIAYGNNRYDEAAKVSETLLAKDPQHHLALNISGVAHFGTHDFPKAVSRLEEAAALGVLHPQLGAPFLEPAKQYQKYWEAEQQIRQRESAATGDAQLPQVLFKTSKGDILLELFENEAPNTVANFISLVEDKFYDGTKFHRVIPGFMAQGGDPNTKPGAFGPPGSGGPGYTIECECYAPNARRHFAGTLSMAHAGKDSGGSQFFITHLPTPHLDREVRPESVHTVFGRVMQGMDVVAALEANDEIQSATVVRKRNHEYAPKTAAAR